MTPDTERGVIGVNVYTSRGKLMCEIEMLENSPYTVAEEIQMWLDDNGYGDTDFDFIKVKEKDDNARIVLCKFYCNGGDTEEVVAVEVYDYDEEDDEEEQIRQAFLIWLSQNENCGFDIL
jgi:hypothetical protein